MISKSRMKFAISKKFSTVSRGYVSPMRSIPPHILAPEYHKSGKPMGMKNNVYIASTSEIVKIRKSAKLARQILEFALSLAKTNRSTEEIDLLCHEEILRLDAYPSPINYGGFPKAICTSVNEVVCHGIPDDRKLREGDILSIDVSVFKDGYHGDNCGTVIVGQPKDQASVKLVQTTLDALHAGIDAAARNKCLSSIGEAIEHVAHSNGFRVVKEFLGHGIGPYLHMLPYVQHYRNTDRLPLVPGMIFTIEPILVEKSADIGVWRDGWTAYTLDYGRAAQFEHQILITRDGAEILTSLD